MTIEKGLLLHWWHCCGKEKFTLAEREAFEGVIDKYGTNRVLDAAVASYITCDGTPSIILDSIRRNVVHQMFHSLPRIENMEQEDKILYEAAKTEFIQNLTKEYKKNINPDIKLERRKLGKAGVSQTNVGAHPCVSPIPAAKRLAH